MFLDIANESFNLVFYQIFMLCNSDEKAKTSYVSFSNWSNARTAAENDY